MLSKERSVKYPMKAEDGAALRDEVGDMRGEEWRGGAHSSTSYIKRDIRTP